MRRFHLFEIEDQSWFPTTLRNLLTDVLQFGIVNLHIYRPALPLLKKLIERQNITQFVDLCSGAGGPWLDLHPQLQSNECRVSVMLTDRYPNLKAGDKIAQATQGQVCYRKTPVNAFDFPDDLPGIRTIFTGFHHFRPKEARVILQNAVDQKVSIGIFEFTERSLLRILLSIAILPVITVLETPFIKPFSLTRLFWSWVLPIIPVVNTWDGIVSSLRTYTPDDLKELTDSIPNQNYAWEIGQITSPTKINRITYLIGYPTQPFKQCRNERVRSSSAAPVRVADQNEWKDQERFET